MYEKLCKHIDNIFYTAQINRNSYEVFAVDCTDNNLRKSLKEKGFKANKKDNAITALNLGIYNVTRNYPVIIEMVKHKNAGEKSISLWDFIKNKNNYNMQFLYMTEVSMV